MRANCVRRSALAMAIACATLLSTAAQAGDLRVVYKVSGMKPPVAAEEPSDFTSHTFTTCGAHFNAGPSLAACRSAYTATNWASDPEQFSVLHDGTAVQGIQAWSVPVTGTYRIEAAGASRPLQDNGQGRGAVISGEFSLRKGQRLLFLVGQTEVDQYGGGGGTFVVDEAGLTPLIVAGGGGGLSGYGTSRSCATSDASFEQAGRSGCGSYATPGGSNGSGGTSSSGVAGAGMFGNSSLGDYNLRAYSFLSVYNGVQTQSPAFGGGGRYVNNSRPSSGGGGGYSGGGVGEDGGGGGGSYNTGANPLRIGYNPIGNNGYVTITRL